MYAYHVVTERPMKTGQQIKFDESHHHGVRQRVYETIELVKEINILSIKNFTEDLLKKLMAVF